MCGLVAMMNYAGQAVDRDQLLRMRDAMAARGPDGAGLWLSDDACVGLAHRRLSLIDLSESGAQPMTNGDESLHIVFNGEIYNYRELRSDLEARGYIFRSSSDTEVLLHLYDRLGEQMVGALRGMYAFVIWDARRKRIFAARDPLGIKPLYYADNGIEIRFASQVRALLAGEVPSPARDPAGLVGFLLWGYVPEPFTTYRSIAALPAGSSMTVEADGRRELRSFYKVSDELAALEQSHTARVGKDEIVEAARHALTDSVRAHLVADVPVAIFLSAGMDSATIAAIAAENSDRPLRSVTLGFEEFRAAQSDETAHAAMLAGCYATDHTTRWFSRNDFEAELRAIVTAMDQPSIDGLNTYFVSKAARSCGVKTALSGVGGDELFATYPSFKDIARITRLVGRTRIPAGGRAFRRLSSPLLSRVGLPKYAGLLEYGATVAGAYLLRRGLFMPWEIAKLLPPEVFREGWQRLAPLDRLEETAAAVESTRAKVSALELTWYMRNQLLRDADWAGMANSIEIRVPLVDVVLLRHLIPLLVRMPIGGKRFLKDVPSRAIPEAVASRPKNGFAVPIHRWLQQPRAGDADPPNLSSGLKRWALRLAREFDFAGVSSEAFTTGS